MHVWHKAATYNGLAAIERRVAPRARIRAEHHSMRSSRPRACKVIASGKVVGHSQLNAKPSSIHWRIRTAGGRIAVMGRPALDISSLTPGERLELIGELWDSLVPDEVPLTPAQRDELQRRLDRLDAEGPRGSPWPDVDARIRNRAR